ncbi:MAG: hypothetical protein O2902_02190 [Actinobacteria bacterium]|nr:hypothetical protein [Actinomycetota bacterium]
MRIWVLPLSLALLVGCSSSQVETGTPVEIIQQQTTALECLEDDAEVQRYLITKSQSKLGAVSASACGYPNSEYGPITVLGIATGAKDSAVVLSEDKSFWIGNETRFVKTDAGWELPGLLGNVADGSEAILKIKLVNEVWQSEIEELPKAHPVSIQSLMKTQI